VPLALAVGLLAGAQPPKPDVGALLNEREQRTQVALAATAADRPADAVKALRRAVEIERELFGPQLDIESPTWVSLAWALVAAGEPKEATELTARVKADTAKATGRADHWRAADADRFATDLAALQKAGTAAKWRACLVRQAKAAALRDADKSAEALVESTAAVADAVAVWGDGHPEVSRARLELARSALAAGKPPDALKAADAALTGLTKVVGKEHPDYAAAQFERGRALAAQGSHKDAATAFGEAAEVYAATLGPAKFDHLQSLRRQADAQDDAGDTPAAAATNAVAIKALVDAGRGRTAAALSLREVRAARLTYIGLVRNEPKRWAEAKSELEQVVEVRKATNGASEGYAWALCQLAAAHRLLGELDACHAALDEGLAVFAKLPKPNLRMVEHGLTTRAQARADGADYRAAVAAWHKVLEHQKTFRTAADPNRIATLESLASVHVALGESRDAVATLEQALDLLRRPRDPQSPGYVKALTGLATAAGVGGDRERVRRALDEAVRVVRGGEFDPSLRADVLVRAGRFRLDVQEWLEADALFVEAEKGLRAAKFTETAEFAYLLQARALAADRARQIDRAASLTRDSLSVLKKVHGPGGPNYLTAVVSAVAYFHGWERNDDAAELLTEYFGAARRQPPPLPTHLQALNLLGMVETARKRYDAADRAYDECLAAARKAFGPRHGQVAHTLSLKAGSAYQRRDFAAMHTLYREALDAFGDDPGLRFAKLACLRTAGIATNAAAAGRRPPLEVLAGGADKDALELLARAADLARLMLDESLAGLSERQQLELTAAARETFDGYLAITRAADAEPAYARVLAWKGAVFARQQQLAAVQRHPARAAAFRELEQVSAALAAVALAAGARPDPANDTPLRALVRRREELERELASDPKLSAELKAVAPAGVATVRDALPPDTALVDFVEYDSPGSIGALFEGRRLAAFVVRAGRPVVRVELGPVEPVAAALAEWNPAAPPTAKGGTAASKLRGLVWQPLAAALAGAGPVLLSPDGVTARIPFPALPGTKPGTFLIEDVTLAAVAVPRALPELLARPAPAGTGLLLVGDVDFNAGAARPLRPGPRFPPLPGTQAEADALSELWRSKFAVPAVELRGAAATETSVRAALGKARYVHLATHGTVGLGRDAVAPVRADNPFVLTPQGAAPAALSAVALAGANRAPDGVDDGFLTALELAALDLRGAELVVLSACDTGLGRAAGGEGVLGLQRAFQVSGAGAVVATLWPVEDDATRALMTEFYRNLWGRKLPKAEALRQAQLRLLRGELAAGGDALAALGGNVAVAAVGTRGVQPIPVAADPRAPARWAAFVLSGDWR
jgi:CHAT domain-containing protein